MMIENIFIDVDDTLLDFRLCARSSMFQTMEEWGIRHKERDFDVFCRENDKLWRRIEEGTLTAEELHRIRWNIVFRELGITGFDGEVFEKAFRDRLKVTAIPVEGANEVLKYLHSKYRVFVASNAPFQQQVDRLTLAGMIGEIDCIFASEKVGFAKPSKEFFAHCFSEIGENDPKKCMMIGDSLSSDIAGGQNFGMKTIWFNRFEKACTLLPPPDYTINSLLELQKIL